MQEEMEKKLEAALAVAPPWPKKTRPQPFSWPYGPRELIAERKRVVEIMALRAKVEKPVDWNGAPTKTGYPMSFQDAFIRDDNHRTWLMLEIQGFRDWRKLAVRENLGSFPDGPSGTAELKRKREADWCASMNVVYGMMEGLLQQSVNYLVEMQALCAELKPETLALAKRCASYEQLDRSMLMMKPEDAEPKTGGFPFEAPRE